MGGKVCIQKDKIFIFLAMFLLTAGILFISNFLSQRKQSITSKAAERKIIGGIPVLSPDDYPYVALINNEVGFLSFQSASCTGVRVAPRWVLTVFHCLAHDIKKSRVAVGIVNRKDFEKVAVDALGFAVPDDFMIDEYKKYDSSDEWPDEMGKKDIALIYLDYKKSDGLKSKMNIIVPKLPELTSPSWAYQYSLINRKPYVIGWGYTDDNRGNLPETLQTTKLKIFDFPYDGTFFYLKYDKGQGQNFSTTADGDSGAPVIVKSNEGYELKKYYKNNELEKYNEDKYTESILSDHVLLGFVVGSDLESGIIEVIDINSYLDWIKEVIESNNPEKYLHDFSEL